MQGDGQSQGRASNGSPPEPPGDSDLTALLLRQAQMALNQRDEKPLSCLCPYAFLLIERKVQQRTGAQQPGRMPFSKLIRSVWG